MEKHRSRNLQLSDTFYRFSQCDDSIDTSRAIINTFWKYPPTVRSLSPINFQVTRFVQIERTERNCTRSAETILNRNTVESAKFREAAGAASRILQNPASVRQYARIELCYTAACLSFNFTFANELRAACILGAHCLAYNHRRKGTCANCEP